MNPLFFLLSPSLVFCLAADIPSACGLERGSSTKGAAAGANGSAAGGDDRWLRQEKHADSLFAQARNSHEEHLIKEALKGYQKAAEVYQNAARSADAVSKERLHKKWGMCVNVAIQLGGNMTTPWQSGGALTNTQLPPNFDPTDGAAAANAPSGGGGSGGSNGGGEGGGSGGGGGQPADPEGQTPDAAEPAAEPEPETGTDMEALQRRLAALRK